MIYRPLRADIPGLSLLALLLLTGCGGGNDKWAARREATYPASGVVLYNSQPVDGAIVVFECLTPGKPGATARTNAKGEFTLTTFQAGDGAVAGNFVASVSKAILEGEDPSYADIESPNYGKEPPAAARGKVRHLVPEKYSKSGNSQLGAEITSAGNTEIRLELKDG